MQPEENSKSAAAMAMEAISLLFIVAFSLCCFYVAECIALKPSPRSGCQYRFKSV
jgi:hypothetical protein